MMPPTRLVAENLTVEDRHDRCCDITFVYSPKSVRGEAREQEI